MWYNPTMYIWLLIMKLLEQLEKWSVSAKEYSISSSRLLFIWSKNINLREPGVTKNMSSLFGN